MQRRHLLASLVGAMALPALAQRGYEITPLRPGLTPPALKTLDLQGKVWDLAELRGRVVVLNFWATWCPPCRAEMPSLQQLADIYGPEQLLVLAVNVGEGPRRIAQYLQASALNLTVLLDSKSDIARLWQVNAMPTTYVIDTEGRPRQRVRGEMDWAGPEAAALVEPLLRGKPQRANGASTQRSNT